MIKRVAVLALDKVAPFELGVICEVFGTDRVLDGFPSYEFDVCTTDGRPVRTAAGFELVPHTDLSVIETADLVAVPAYPRGAAVPVPALDALRRAASRGAYVISVCSGAFALGEAGLLDGRRCTTHWIYAEELARRFPEAHVEPNSLYVEDLPIFTSAGTAAGIDLCLHIVRREHGSAVATKMARRMVVPPHRDGGQAQYVEAPIAESPEAATLEPLLEWMIGHLDQAMPVDELANRVHMAPRTFARRFAAETGTTPHDWLIAQRVLLARRLLEDTDQSVDAIAAQSGFGAAAVLRHHFARRLDSTPQAYRRLFHARSAVDSTASAKGTRPESA